MRELASVVKEVGGCLNFGTKEVLLETFFLFEEIFVFGLKEVEFLAEIFYLVFTFVEVFFLHLNDDICFL